jgi:hypothetical protein
LTTISPQLIRSNSSYVIQSYYNAIQINLLQDGTYTFRSQSQIDLYGYLYQNYFNNTNVNLNLIISDNDSGGNNQFSFQYYLSSYFNYILVVTTSNNNTVGSYSVYVKGPSLVIFYSI